MKKILKKVSAGVSALVVTATMSATTISAFAAEYEVMEAQEFVASFEDASAQNVAQYCVDNGMSLDAIKDMMVIYQEGVQEIADSNSVVYDGTTITIGSNASYYSGTQSTNTPHRGVIFANNIGAQVVASFITTFTNAVSYDTNTLPHTMKNGYPDLTFTNVSTSSIKKITMAGYLPSKGTSGDDAKMVLTFPFSKGTGTTESSLKDGIVFQGGNTSINGEEGDFDRYTYALGDLDHDGDVDSVDQSIILDFLVGNIKVVKFNFLNVTAEIASPLFVLSLDANEDGAVDISDSVKINKWVSGDFT